MGLLSFTNKMIFYKVFNLLILFINLVATFKSINNFLNLDL